MGRFLLIVYLVVVITASDNTNPLYHVTFTNRDHITPNATVERYPEIKASMSPERITYRMHQIHNELRNYYYFESVTVINRSISDKCYGYSSCLFGHSIRDFINHYLIQRPKIRNLYFLFIMRDETHPFFIRDYLRRLRLPEPAFSEAFELNYDLMLSMPNWMLSIDLDNPL